MFLESTPIWSDKRAKAKLIISQNGTSTIQHTQITADNISRPVITRMGTTQVSPSVRTSAVGRCVKKGASEGQQAVVDYAFQISQGDRSFIGLLEAENGLWDFKRQSEVRYNGKREQSYGLCQIHKSYHKKIVNDKRFFTDWKWQLEQCWELYKQGTPFGGRKNIKKALKNFICK